MNGPYADDIGGYGGPSDDGVAAALWLAFRDCEGLEAASQAARDRAPGGLLAALLEPLSPSVGRWGR